MTTILINNFSGGQSEDIRELKTNTYNVALNFDTYTNQALTPYIDMESESMDTGDITDKRITDIIIGEVSGSVIGAIGRDSGTDPTSISLYDKTSSTNIAASYTYSSGSALIAGYLAHKNSVAIYLNHIYLITTEGIARYYDGTWHNLGSVGTTWQGNGIPRPYRHPADDLLYIAYRNKVYRTNSAGTSISLYFTFPDKYLVTSMTNFGSDLACSLCPIYGGKSYVAILDRVSTNTSARDIMDWGEGSLAIIENIGGVLIGVSSSEILFSPTATYSSSIIKKIIAKGYAGGQVETIKEMIVPSTVSLTNMKRVKHNRLYFGCNNDDALYAIYKNTNGGWSMNKEYYYANGATITTLNGFNFIDDYLFTMFDTAGQAGNFYRTKVGSYYTNTCVFETNINPSMPVADRTKKKQLKSLSVATIPLPTSAQIVLKYSVDGSAFTEVTTETTDGKIKIQAINEYTGKPFEAGYEYQFRVESTGYAQITEIKYDYDVLDEII